MQAASVLTRLEQVSTEWLSAVLRRDGALTHGAVASFEVEGGAGNWSTSGTLRLRYTADAEGARPPRLFLKMVDTDTGDGEFFGPSEVTYYTQDYVGVLNAPLLRCYDAAYSEEEHCYHLLLDDVSESHVEAAEKPPTLAYGLALAEGLAVLHAHWWGSERLKAADAPIHDADHIRRFIEIAEPGAGPILAGCAEALREEWPVTLQKLFSHHTETLIARTSDANGFTLIHGDVGHGNVLVPRAGERPIYIIDRQPFDWGLTTWLGAYDLAYAIVLDWPIDARRAFEMAILQHYHSHLTQNGVKSYSWERLMLDYRLCVPMCVFVAVEYCRGGHLNEPFRHVWLPMLQRALTACDDLSCNDFWQAAD